MTTQPKTETVPAATSSTTTAPPVPVMTAAEIQAVIATGVATALSAERTRASAIRTCEEAKGRETLASHLADNTSMSVDEAKAILAAAQKAEAKTETKPGSEVTGRATGFGAAMDRTQNPGVGADQGTGAETTGGEPAPEATANRLLGNWSKMTGRKPITIDQPAGRA